jgi:putative endonuclease
MTKSGSSPRQDTPRQTIGQWGEDFISQWLQQLGWQIVAQRWRCRWGELDIVAQTLPPNPMLIVVEVKVRNRANWDHTGLLAITPQKQRKLLQATELFLSEHGELADYPCRFDVALVQRQPTPQVSVRSPQGIAFNVGEPLQRSNPFNSSSATPESLAMNASINTVDQAAIAPFFGLPSAPIEAIQTSQVPWVCVGNEILRLQHYLDGAF